MRRIFTVLVLVLSLAFVTACGGGDTSMDVRKPAAERPDIDKSVAQRGALRIPTAEKFNYTSFRSGQTGNGRGESKADGKNGAICRAEAADGSNAWSEFQLGYCFDNAGDAPLDAVVKLNVKVSEKSRMKNDSARDDHPAATAKGTLSFFIKDSNGTLLKTENLLSSNLMKGPNSSGIAHELVFDARFEPQRGYYLVMAGRSEVQAAEGQSASVAMEVKEAALEIEWRPAASASASEAKEPVASNTPERADTAP